MCITFLYFITLQVLEPFYHDEKVYLNYLSVEQTCHFLLILDEGCIVLMLYVLIMAWTRFPTFKKLRRMTVRCAIAVGVCLFAAISFFSYRCIQISKLRNPYILDNLSYQSQDIYDRMSGSSKLSLRWNLPPVTVHFMWCRKSHFEYTHYLSLLSVTKVLVPDQIVFHYLELPQEDNSGYFTWFEDIQRQVPMLVLRKIVDLKHCGENLSAGVQQCEDFPTAQGVFMTDDIAVFNLSREVFFRLAAKSDAVSEDCHNYENGSCRYILPLRFQLFLVPYGPYSILPGHGRVVYQCPTIDMFNYGVSHFCIHLSQRLFPSDIRMDGKLFGSYARSIIFNSEEVTSLIPQSTYFVPHIAHIQKFDDESISQLCYKSIESAVEIGQLKHIFLHGSVDEKHDALWGELFTKFSISHIPTPHLDSKTSSQEQMLYGLNVLLQYGGVLMRCGTVIQKSFRPLLHYSAVSSVEKSAHRITHHRIDFGVLIAAPSSLYLYHLIPVVKQWLESGSTKDISTAAYHIYENFPASVLIKSDLIGHMTCQYNKCLPVNGQHSGQNSFAVKFIWTVGASSDAFNYVLNLKTSSVS